MADIQERLQTTLGATYQIERELGGGGMSRVFLARERELGRRVVVKVLPPELGADLNTDRFRREIQLAASLQHPHIVSVLTAGQADGLLYYTMPLIEGESLRERLDREGELPIGVCIRILRDVVDALAYAHRHGAVHRDIKPGNILLTDQHAMVTDFGVAKALSAATDRASLTATGLVLGTPAYMSPEQAAADPHIDHRADIYAVGAVAYEMLTGQQPFRGVSVQAVLAAQLTRTPDPVSTHRQLVPPPLAALVMRCLEKRPADRSQTADELKHELETIGGASVGATGDQSLAVSGAASGALMLRARLLPVLALYVLMSLGVLGATRLATYELGLPDWVFPGAVILLLIGLPIIATTAIVQRGWSTRTPLTQSAPRSSSRHWFTWRKAIMGGGLAFALWGAVVAGYMAMRALGIGPVGSLLAAGVIAPRERILVADFTNRTADSLLGAVATEAFRIDFAQSPVVNVLAPNYVREALRRMKKPPESPLDLTLAREVAIREGLKAVIAGEIGTAGTRFVVSARLVSAETGEVFAAYRETAADSTEVIAAIDKLSEKLRERIGESLRTIRAGEPLERVTTASLEALRKYSQGVRAVEREGEFARGIDLLEEAIALDTTFAMAYRKLGIHLSNEPSERSRSVRALTKAFEYRDRLTERERYLARGSYYTRVIRDEEKAIAAYRTLLGTYPDEQVALNNLGVIYGELRQDDRAEESYRRAIELDSTLRLAYTNLAFAQVSLGKLTDAQATLDRAATKLPGNPDVAYYQSALAVARGDYDAAATQLRQLKETQRENLQVQVLTSAALASLAALRGRLAEAEPQLRNAMDAAEQRRLPAQYLMGAISAGYLDVAIRAAPEHGIRRVEEALARHPLSTMAPLDRLYDQLAFFFALAGRPDRARALRSERDSVTPPELRQLTPQLEHAPLGAIAVAERRFGDAISEFRMADYGPCRTCMLPYLGRAYDLAGQPDSTILIYERYLATPNLFRAYPPFIMVRAFGDALFLAPIHKRLGELYEERGNRTKAAEHYARLVEIWKDADPELRPTVADARRSLARLSGERPR